MHPPEQRRPQPWPIRLTHWANVPLLAILAASGLQILAAYPRMGPRGQPYALYPFQGAVPPSWLRLGDWLAGARHWHFAFGWFLALNGVVYVLYLAFSGEWRRRLFLPRRDTQNAVATLAYYLRIRPAPEQVGLYNGLQRLAYTSALGLGALSVLSGLALHKPVQLRWLTSLFGGYDPARAVHLLLLALLALFTVGHVLLVALHPRTFGEMVTGGRRPRV
ncbi:thiosulfate reductase [Corallococcus praedator]|uniref:Thiosulfate reductase n=1 Tax=Corallococcus praedator TaxID=2316724 RepID=A0ABX9QEC9_9BACT|nr:MULTISPECIES: cytochrome b/b6 domain-containing protein [Corallococcus]RKH07604.1 thiosulfate reductase [Corallococcus sp. CA047B]RKH32737.1 thiosulfate reductase [Corallococcus sp. CA031C]RKI05678.1 thiosulfate reductase [Corallococcus praedator]